MGIWRSDGACLDFLGFGKGVWQPIPPFPGLGCASALTPAPFLPSAPLSTLSGCCLEPTRFVQFCSWRGMGVGEGPDLCVCPGRGVLGVGWPRVRVSGVPLVCGDPDPRYGDRDVSGGVCVPSLARCFLLHLDLTPVSPRPQRTARLLSLSLSLRNWSLPCLFLEFGEEEEEEAGRQTSHTLARPPGITGK